MDMEITNRVMNMAADIMQRKLDKNLYMIKSLEESETKDVLVMIKRLKKEVKEIRRAIKHIRKREGCWY